MAKFQHRENGKIVELLEVNEKSKAVLVQYVDTKKTTNFSPSTWKRYWRKLEEEQPVVEEVAPVETVSEVAGDGTSYSQVLSEIQADEKLAVEKKQKKQREKKVTNKKRVQNENVPGILEYIAGQAVFMNNYVRDKQPELVNYRIGEGKVRFVARKVYDRVELLVKSRDINEELASKLDTQNNFYDKKLVIRELTDDNKLLIDSIINSFKEE